MLKFVELGRKLLECLKLYKQTLLLEFIVVGFFYFGEFGLLVDFYACIVNNRRKTLFSDLNIDDTVKANHAILETCSIPNSVSLLLGRTPLSYD